MKTLLFFLVAVCISPIHIQAGSVYRSIKPIDIPVRVVYDDAIPVETQPQPVQPDQKIEHPILIEQPQPLPVIEEIKLEVDEKKQDVLLEGSMLEAVVEKMLDESLKSAVEAQPVDEAVESDPVVTNEVPQVGVQDVENPEEVEPENVNEEVVVNLRKSESHPAQVPSHPGIALKVGFVDEEKTEELIVEALRQAENASEPPKPSGPFANLQQTIGNVIDTIRPSNIVQAVANRFNRTSNGTRQDEEGNGETEPTAKPPPVFVTNVQNGITNTINSFRDTVNNVINNFRPQPAPGAENDEVPPRPLLDSIQQNFNNSINGFSTNINNFINTFTQSTQQSETQNDEQQPGFIQNLQSQVQQNLANIGQTITSNFGFGNSSEPKPGNAENDEEPAPSPGPLQQIQSAINNSFTSFTGNINSFIQNLSDSNNGGVISNIINQINPTTQVTVLGDEQQPTTRGPFNPAQAIQSGFSSLLNVLRPASNGTKSEQTKTVGEEVVEVVQEPIVQHKDTPEVVNSIEPITNEEVPKIE